MDRLVSTILRTASICVHLRPSADYLRNDLGLQQKARPPNRVNFCGGIGLLFYRSDFHLHSGKATMRIEDLDTPALLVDLDGLEDNLDRYQRYFDEHGIGLRPHIKTHKCVAIAHMQMRRGAIGITCQKLGEAEVMAEGGVGRDILIPYNIIGAQKLARLVALARTSTSSVGSDTRLTVAADSEYTVQGLAEAAAAADVTVGVVVELDRGRTGVGSPAAAAAPRRKNRSSSQHRTPGHHVHAGDSRHAVANPRDARAFRPQGLAASHRQRR